MPAYHIPMSSPDLSADDIAAVNAVLQTPVLSIGPQMRQSPSLGGTIVPVLGGIEAFEQAAAEAVGAKFGVGVNSGTAGLPLAGGVGVQ